MSNIKVDLTRKCMICNKAINLIVYHRYECACGRSYQSNKAVKIFFDNDTFIISGLKHGYIYKRGLKHYSIFDILQEFKSEDLNKFIFKYITKINLS